MRAFILFAVGLVFGMGLYLSGMTQPTKVQGFLDIAGRWDPSLAFVMGGRARDWVPGLFRREATEPDFSRRPIAASADRHDR